MLAHDRRGGVLPTTSLQYLSVLMLPALAILVLLALFSLLAYIALGSHESSLKHLPGPHAASWVIGLQVTYQVGLS